MSEPEQVGNSRVQAMTGAGSLNRGYEFINCEQLAERWCLPESWVRDQVRGNKRDPLPHVRFGKYVRFRWGSPELEEWAERRIVGGLSSRTSGRVRSIGGN
jgi:hypothetical protein